MNQRKAGLCPAFFIQRRLLAFFRNERHHSLPQLRQPAMEKMLPTPDDKQVRSRLQAVYPIDRFINVYKFVLIPLNDEPGTVRLRFKAGGETTDRRRNTDESVHMHRDGSFDRNGCAKRKTGEPQGVGSVACAHPLNCGDGIIEFAHAIVVSPFALFRTSKIEAQCFEPRPGKCSRQHMRNLIVHCAAVLRVGMAYNGAAMQCTLTWPVDNSLQAANRAVYKQLFSNGVFGHSDCRGG